VEVGILIFGSGNNFTVAGNARHYSRLRRVMMQGEEIKTTYRELINLRLIYKYCDCTGIDLDDVYSDLDKSVTLTETILKGMDLA
jgi:hypothetical protein